MKPYRETIIRKNKRRSHRRDTKIVQCKFAADDSTTFELHSIKGDLISIRCFENSNSRRSIPEIDIDIDPCGKVDSIGTYLHADIYAQWMYEANENEHHVVSLTFDSEDIIINYKQIYDFDMNCRTAAALFGINVNPDNTTETATLLAMYFIEIHRDSISNCVCLKI